MADEDHCYANLPAVALRIRRRPFAGTALSSGGQLRPCMRQDTRVPATRTMHAITSVESDTKTVGRQSEGRHAGHVGINACPLARGEHRDTQTSDVIPGRMRAVSRPEQRTKGRGHGGTHYCRASARLSDVADRNMNVKGIAPV